jgi:hypothetical protein
VSDEPKKPATEPAKWAAEEPTAMWDESSMREQGYDALAKDREAKPRQETGPATELGVRGQVKEGVEVSRALTGNHAAVKRPQAKPQSSALSWVITFAVALVLGVGVFFLLRMFL